ncbi:hypothetical protein R3P38DRAFT_2634095 [Favolaschia claudopus]|uniref:F-box domain-containing protein n=1 Tax=Favolaschia claudopus TaxID=2862362 RepID=A0AAW0AZI9_9AGAR
MQCLWSRIPAEIGHEITAYNAHDVDSLRAMCLASSATRSLAIIHLFSMIHFACVEDFTRWLGMLARTPALKTIPKIVKFSQPDEKWLKRHRKLASATLLHEYSGPPLIPTMPRVRSVEWKQTGYGDCVATAMLVSYLALFPNIRSLRLSRLDLTYNQLTHVLGACGPLKSLLFANVSLGADSQHRGSDADDPAPFDLTALEHIEIRTCTDVWRADPISRLIAASQPRRITNLCIGDIFQSTPYRLDSLHELLRFCAPTLVNLVVDPGFEEADLIFGRLPDLPSLESLNLWINERGCAADIFINEIASAPILSRVSFRCVLDEVDEDDNLYTLTKIIDHFWPWQTRWPYPWREPESMQSLLHRQIPACKRLVFQFCTPLRTNMHLRSRVRRKMEQRLHSRLVENGAALAVPLGYEWLDGEYEPVEYSTRSGRPFHRVRRNPLWDLEFGKED